MSSSSQDSSSSESEPIKPKFIAKRKRDAAKPDDKAARKRIVFEWAEPTSHARHISDDDSDIVAEYRAWVLREKQRLQREHDKLVERERLISERMGHS